MKIFGLTGGMGMGKTTAADWLSAQGLPVIDTDLLARQVVEPGEPALHAIEKAFGPGVLTAEGRLNRPALAQIVFADPAARRTLESLTHPRIRALWQQQISRWRTQQQRLGIVVIPLLFETQAQSDFDATICVACTLTTQHQRLMARGWTDSQIQGRLLAQWPVEKKMAAADYVAWSEGVPQVLAGQLERILAFVP